MGTGEEGREEEEEQIRRRMRNDGREERNRRGEDWKSIKEKKDWDEEERDR